MELGLTSYPAGRFTVLAVEGEIDLSTAPQLQRALEELGPTVGDVVLDFSQVTFLDSTGVGALIHGRRQLAEGASLRLVSDRPAVVKLFELTGLTQMIPIYPTIEDAIA